MKRNTCYDQTYTCCDNCYPKFVVASDRGKSSKTYDTLSMPKYFYISYLYLYNWIKFVIVGTQKI